VAIAGNVDAVATPLVRHRRIHVGHARIEADEGARLHGRLGRADRHARVRWKRCKRRDGDVRDADRADPAAAPHDAEQPESGDREVDENR
jgi:hypothetical protein